MIGRYDRGFLSPYFITNAEKMEAVLEDPFVLLCGRKISVLKDLFQLRHCLPEEIRNICPEPYRDPGAVGH